MKKIVGEILNKYAKDPKVRSLIEKLLDENARLKVHQRESGRLRSMLAHELRGPLVAIKGYTELLQRQNIEPEREGRYYEVILNNVGQILDLVRLLEACSTSKKEIKQGSEIINLEDTVRRQIKMHEEELNENGIGLRFKYDKPSYTPISIYANPGIINAVLGTLLGNAINWAPANTRITEAFRITKKNELEFLIENAHQDIKPRGNVHGLGRGYGLPFVSHVIHMLEGAVSIYHKPRIGTNYTNLEKWGNPNAQNGSEKVYSVRLLIPMKELAIPPEPQDKA